MRLFVHFYKLLTRRHACDILFLIAGADHILQRRHSDHEKLIQIRGCDTQEF